MLLIAILATLGHSQVPAALESERIRCQRRTSKSSAARKPFDLNTTFLPILESQAFKELEPEVLSVDPWVVYFHKFMTEAEVQACEKHLFAPERESEFKASAAGGAGKHSARYSETAFCIGACDDHEIIQNVRKRASSIVGVPTDNFDLSQALRYKETMFYKAHHDNHPSFHFGPSGARIFTYFVYLSDKGMQGGETNFPNLQIKAPAKRGAAVLFVNTKDRNPMETDARTLHESLPVTAGQKRGMNMWLYQYNYRDFWSKGCATIELADKLGRYGKAAVDVLPQVTFQNDFEKLTLHVFEVPYASRGYADHQRSVENPNFVGSIEPGRSLSVDASEGAVFHVKSAKQDGKLVAEKSVIAKRRQTVRLGKSKKQQAQASGEL